MDDVTAAAINEHLGAAFDHLREAIMLSVAGPRPEGALGRLERFAATGDTGVLVEGMEGLFDDGPFSTAVPAREYEDAPLTVEEMEQAATDLSGILAADQEPPTPTDPEVKRAFNPAFEGDEGDDEESEFDGLFDDIDEDEGDDGPSDAPAAF